MKPQTIRKIIHLGIIGGATGFLLSGFLVLLPLCFIVGFFHDELSEIKIF